MWLIFTIATTLIWGFAELFYKKGARQTEKYAHLKICICVGAVMGIHAIFTLLTQHIGYNPINLLRYLPVSACYILSMSLSFFGIRYIEESISDPVENTSGAICFLMCAAFMGQSISKLAYIAVLLIVIGIIGLGYLEKRGETDRSKVLGKKMAVIAFAMPFCYAIIDALGSFLDIYYLDTATSPLADITDANIELVANTTYELTFAICAIILYIFIRVRGDRFICEGERLSHQKYKILAAICETAGQLTYVFAMSGNGAIAAPIISSVCIVSLLLSRIVLKEKLSRSQYAYLLIVIVGIMILAVIDC